MKVEKTGLVGQVVGGVGNSFLVKTAKQHPTKALLLFSSGVGLLPGGFPIVGGLLGIEKFAKKAAEYLRVRGHGELASSFAAVSELGPILQEATAFRPNCDSAVPCGDRVNLQLAQQRAVNQKWIPGYETNTRAANNEALKKLLPYYFTDYSSSGGRPPDIRPDMEIVDFALSGTMVGGREVFSGGQLLIWDPKDKTLCLYDISTLSGTRTIPNRVQLSERPRLETWFLMQHINGANASVFDQSSQQMSPIPVAPAYNDGVSGDLNFRACYPTLP